MMTQLWREFRQAVSSLRRTPALSAVAIVTLAVGVGANGAIFSAVEAVLIRSLPYPHPDRLAVVWSSFGRAGQTRVPSSGPALAALAERSRQLERVAGIWAGTAGIAGSGEPEQIKVGFVTGNFFGLLGASAALGRTIAPAEEGPAARRVLVVSDRLWRRRWGADPGVIGSEIRFDGESATIVGVMPPNFSLIFPSDATVPPDIEAWTPFRDRLAELPRDLNFLRLVARLRNGATVAAANDELSRISADLRRQFREYSEAGLTLEASPLDRDAAREYRGALLALFGCVSLVLLIACTNVANLLLARASRRRREFAIRTALGASRARILRQLLAEGAVLGAGGAILGVAFAEAGLRVLLKLRPPALSRLAEVSLTPGVVAYCLAATSACAILFGLAPALEAFSESPARFLRSASRAAGGGEASRRALVAVETAVGFVLLVGAIASFRTLTRFLSADPGFRAERVLAFEITPAEARYPADADRIRLVERLSRSFETIPGVVSVGGASHLPVDDYPNWYGACFPEGTRKEDENRFLADHRSLLPATFGALGIPILSGREFSEHDASNVPRVAVVDERLAARLWPGRSAIGRRVNVEAISEGNFGRAWAEVVGVARHVRSAGPTDAGRDQIYFPYAQSARGRLAFVLKLKPEAGASAEAVRGAVRAVDSDLPVSKLRMLGVAQREAAAPGRFSTLLAGALAATALALAIIGIYAVTSFSTLARTKEIGIRLAFGARTRDVLRIVISRGMRPVAAGTAAGAGISLVALPMSEPISLGASAALLTAAAAAACLVPALKASRVDPVVTLRAE